MKKILLFPMIAIALFMVACSDKDNNITDTPVTPPVEIVTSTPCCSTVWEVARNMVTVLSIMILWPVTSTT